MTLIKNPIKLLIGIFAVVCVATTQKAGAVPIYESPNFQTYSRVCSNSNLSYHTSYNFFNRCTDGTRKAIEFDFNGTPLTSYDGSSTSSSSSHNFMGNFKKQSGYLDLKTYNVYYDLLTEQIPFAGITENFNGESITLNNIFFLNNSFILYDDAMHHTLQYIGNYKIKDYIIFIDPLTETLNSSTYDNFYLISISQKKAWSFKMLSQHISNIYYGNLADYDIKIFPYVNSYTLLPTNNTTIFPKYTTYMNSSSSFIPNDPGFLYNKDMEYIAPNFGSDTNDNNTNIHSPTYNTDVINNYNYCVNKGENLRKGLQLAIMCKNQGEDLRENIIIDTGLNYTGILTYCLQLDNFIVNAYQTYSGNWNNGVIDENVNLQYQSAPFNDLLFSWYYNSIVIDENHNITGLPNGNSWCAALTIADAYEDQKSYIEKVADSLTNFFGSGVAKDYIDSVNEHASFSGLITSIKNGTFDYFDNYFFDPFETQFNSGYNAFNSKFGFESCQDIQAKWGFLQLGDYIVYICAALIIFIFLLCI